MTGDSAHARLDWPAAPADRLARRGVLLAGLATATSLMARSAGAAVSATPIYAIRQDGDMLFYAHSGLDDGAATWPVQAKKIGNGWNFREAFAGQGGAVYAIQQNGDMLFYRHAGMGDGSANWPIQAQKIGNGWDFRHVFAGDNGAIYAIQQNGDMLFYRHAGFHDGSPNWSIQAKKIGNGWDFREVFAGR